MSPSGTNKVLDKFFLGRISTNLLISHYLDLYEGGQRGIIDRQCDVYEICRFAQGNVGNLALKKYGMVPEIEIKMEKPQRLAYPSRHLHFIVFELLKNAALATIKQSLQHEIPVTQS